MKNKTLSDWIVEKDIIGQDKKIGYIHMNAVREFIYLLKKAIKKRKIEDPQDNRLAYTFNSWLEDVIEIIDKRAGKKLI